MLLVCYCCRHLFSRRKRQNSQTKALGVKKKHVEEEEAGDSDSSGDEGEEEVITPSQRGPPPLLHVPELNPKGYVGIHVSLVPASS